MLFKNDIIWKDNKLKNPRTSKPKTDIIYNSTYMTSWKKNMEMKNRAVVAERLRWEKMNFGDDTVALYLNRGGSYVTVCSAKTTGTLKQKNEFSCLQI